MKMFSSKCHSVSIICKLSIKTIHIHIHDLWMMIWMKWRMFLFIKTYILWFYMSKGCTRLAAASDKAYQLFAHGRWFSPSTPASSTTKTGRHDIAEMLLKVALSTKKSIKQSNVTVCEFITCTRNLMIRPCNKHIMLQRKLNDWIVKYLSKHQWLQLKMICF